MSKGNTTPSEPQLNDLETHLAEALKRVAPRRDFVHRLRQRMRFPPPEEIATRLQDWRRLFIVFGGVIAGLMVIITIARALFHLFGRKQVG